MPSKLMQHTRNTRIHTIRNRFGIIIDLYWRNYHFCAAREKQCILNSVKIIAKSLLQS